PDGPVTRLGVGAAVPSQVEADEPEPFGERIHLRLPHLERGSQRVDENDGRAPAVDDVVRDHATTSSGPLRHFSDPTTGPERTVFGHRPHDRIVWEAKRPRKRNRPIGHRGPLPALVPRLAALRRNPSKTT